MAPGFASRGPLARLLLTALALGLCVAVLVPQVPSWLALWATQQTADWRFAVLAVALFTLHTALVLSAWQYSLKFVGVSVRFGSVARIFSFSLLTRYLPGGLWHLGSRLAALTWRGADAVRVGCSLLLEQLAALLMCGFLVLLLLLLDPAPIALFDVHWPWVRSWWPLLALATAGAVVLLYPPVFHWLLDWTALRLRRPRLSNFPATGPLMRLYGLHLLALLVFAGAYGAAALIYLDVLPLSPVGFGGAVLAATLMGFLAPFVPSGLGVREAALALFLHDTVTGPALVAVVVAPRLLLMVAELGLLAVVLMLPQSRENA
jgi:glycosyltransferase 2 family protein